MSKTLCCFIASLGLIVSVASAQVGTLTNVGSTQSGMDALAFNSSGTLYGATAGSSGSGSLYTINTSTGAATLVAALVDATNATLHYAITGLAFQPGTGTLYGSTSQNSSTAPDSLVTINPSTGKVTLIGSYGLTVSSNPQTAADITFTPGGTLYGWMEPDTDGLATINLSTGAAATVGSTGNDTFGSGLASNSSGVLYYAGKGTNGAFWTLNPSTGVPTQVGTITGGPGLSDSIPALAFSPAGVLFAINGGDGSPSANLVTVALAAPAPPGTPVPATWLLSAVGLVGLGLYQARERLLSLVR
jgi:hypothetical protein